MTNNKAMAKILTAGLCLWAAAAGAADNAAGGDAAQKEMMELMVKAGTPAEGHARLKTMEGRWNAAVKSWMKPGGKPEQSKGSATFTWIFGGRFLRQDFIGDWGGMKFEGLGYVGYDNTRQEYTNVWMDSMSTGMAAASGQYDASSKSIRDQGTASCPMTGEKNMWYRSEWKLGRGDSHTYAMYTKDEKGKEFKSMEIVYTRAK
jgi:hypothetical protein